MSSPVRRPPTPDTQRWWPTAIVSAGVIAVCYGFARYAYGLFVPEFARVFGLTATGIGILGGVSTLGYTLGLLIAPRAASANPRAATLAAGSCASVGLVFIGVSGPFVVVFGAGLLIAGAGAGLVSPGVAQLIARSIAPASQPRAQSCANTGTSLGLAASAFTPVLALGWQSIWLGLGCTAAIVTAIAWMRLPRPAAQPAAAEPGVSWQRPGLALLLANSILLGVTSAPYWSFSIDRVLRTGLDPAASGWFWLTIGLAGPVGGIVGALATRHGLTRTNVWTWTIWAAGIMILAIPTSGLPLALVSVAIFGATYMGLSGLCILWAARLYTEAPALGVTLSFLGLGAGQTLGSPLAGIIADHAGLGIVFAATATLSLTAWAQAHFRLRIA